MTILIQEIQYKEAPSYALQDILLKYVALLITREQDHCSRAETKSVIRGMVSDHDVHVVHVRAFLIILYSV